MNISTTVRPWGSFTRFTHNEPSTVKLLNIKKGEETSLQYHAHRQEFWKIISGSPKIIVGDETFYPHIGEEFTVQTGAQHQISAPTDDVVVLEISTGDFDENDIVRVTDKYNRVT